MYFIRATLHIHNRSTIATPNHLTILLNVLSLTCDHAWCAVNSINIAESIWFSGPKQRHYLKKKLLLNSPNKGIFNTHGIKSRGRLLRASWKILMSKGIKHIKQNAFNSLKKKIKPCNFLIKEYYLCSTTYMNFAQLFALICVQMGNYHSNHGVRKHSCSILNI